MAGDPPDRNAVASAMLTALVGRIEAFDRDGAGDLAREWRDADALADRQVMVDLGDEQVTGRAVGIDEDGALRVEHEGGTMRVTAGDVSVRAER